jgi:HTH-type transcriptional regulator/antitoxin HigA
VLKFLMEQRRLTTGELGAVLGSSSAASMIVKGDRDISKANIRKLAAYFGVSPAAFI